MVLEVIVSRARRARRVAHRVIRRADAISRRGSAAVERVPLAAVLVAASALVAASIGCDGDRAPRPEQPATLEVQPSQPSQPAQLPQPAGENVRDPADPRLAALREQAHITLSEYCGRCHTRSQPTAVPGALAVFDLDEPDWYAAFNRAKFPGAKRRIASEATDDERRVFEAWVDAELALAGDAPDEPAHAGGNAGSAAP